MDDFLAFQNPAPATMVPCTLTVYEFDSVAIFNTYWWNEIWDSINRERVRDTGHVHIVDSGVYRKTLYTDNGVDRINGYSFACYTHDLFNNFIWETEFSLIPVGKDTMLYTYNSKTFVFWK
jgi:hypothetical protein